MVKIGKPFVMLPDIGMKVVNYILSMQDLGFGLTIRLDKQLSKLLKLQGKIICSTRRVKWLVCVGGTSSRNDTTCQWGQHKIYQFAEHRQ